MNSSRKFLAGKSVSRWKIIHADARELVVVPDGMTETDTFRKDTR
jgi:hypothetical protein